MLLREVGLAYGFAERPLTAPLQLAVPVTGQFRPHGDEHEQHYPLHRGASTASRIREASFQEVLDAARLALAKRVRRSPGFTWLRVTADYLRVRLSALDHEVFCVIFLTKRHQFIACEDLFRGTIDGASVYPREVLKEALKRNAAAVILAHNHPSGIAEPSQADLLITKQLKA